MYSPTEDEVERLSAEGYGAIPVSRSILADVRTPMEVLNALLRIDSHCYILESVEDRQRWGRYTFLGFDPVLSIVCSDGRVTVTEEVEGRAVETDRPSDVIRQVLTRFRSPRLDGMPPFTGGLVGYFSYDYIKYAEPTLRIGADDDEGFNDADLMLFDKVIAFDNLRQTITVIVNAIPGRRDYDGACGIVDSIIDTIRNGEPREHVPVTLRSDFAPIHREERYCEMVETAKGRIREGDIFQVVLSNRLEAEMEGSLLDVYRVLRTTNPSPYMFYFSGSDIEVAGASPETLVKLKNGSIGCISPCFTTDEIELVPAWEIFDKYGYAKNGSYIEQYVSHCAEEGVDKEECRKFLDYQFMIDFIMTNKDRHLSNFGLLRDSRTLECISPAPIFDSGNSMFYDGVAVVNYRSLLDVKIQSLYSTERKTMENVVDPYVVDLSRLPTADDIRSFYEKDPALSAFAARLSGNHVLLFR